MKNHIYTVLIFTITIIASISCDEYLEVIPKNTVTEGTIWNSEENANLLLYNLFSGLPRNYNTNDPEDNYSDDSMNDLNYAYSRATYALSNYNPSNGPSRWSLYNSIRACNIFIQKAEESSLAEDWKKQSIAEARFLRAFYYSELFTYHGGVPIIKVALDRNEMGDEIFYPRSSAEETFNFITGELKDIVNDLPVSVASKGRVSKGAALALKGWLELFWASPLYNTTNDLGRWRTAAETNKEIIDMDVYDLFPDYQTMFYEDNNDNIEEIFSRQYLGGSSLGAGREGLQAPYNVNGESKSHGGVRPTQDLVDAYFMNNGLPIDDPESGYDPQNPYLNRDKRFYQSISYNGAEWLGYTMDYILNGTSLNRTDLNDAFGGSNTGYDLVKGMDPKYAIHGNHLQSSASEKYFRFAEILLSFAEAKNEAEGPTTEVYSAINRVRTRSGLPDVKSGLDKDEMRKYIRQERRVELAFEMKRLRDLMRWKTAEDVLNKNLRGIKIEKEANGNLKYTTFDAAGGARMFNDRNYLWPIPQSAMDRNPKLEQNPGY